LIVKAIPSLLTLGNMVLGLVAMALVGAGLTSDAALMVVIGMVLDGLDGRAARLLHAESEFGKQLDSLSDIVTFGVAPAFIMYNVILRDLGWLGIVLALLFPMCGALRLARFNITRKSTNYFVGLPITAGGGILATMALYKNLLNPSDVILPIGMLLLSVLMVSNVRYPNFKKVAFPRSAVIGVPVIAFVVYIVFRFQQAAINRIIFAALALYALYGVGRVVKRSRRLHRRSMDTDVDLKKPVTKHE
jgi:CDP-diacylglycerol---serine O-phosphatidyltransferase